MNDERSAVVLAGVPAMNNTLYRRLRFSVGDPVALIELVGPDPKRILILRDIELGRARRHARVDEALCPADFTPAGGLSGDRETATAQALAESLVRFEVAKVTVDRTFPMIYAHHLNQRGIEVHCDLELGVMDRRAKDDEEIGFLQHAQAVTEGAIELACQLIAKATAKADGILHHDGGVLTSERIREAVDVHLLKLGFVNPTSIVAGGLSGADCHDVGAGPLRTGEPVIVDIFPQDRQSRYYGDCTRTVVHGAIPDEIKRMHAAVIEAKRAAIDTCRAGVTGDAVHEAAAQVMRRYGYAMGLPGVNDPDTYCSMVHGTGHGIGLDVHEPPLLDRGGPALVVGDAVTIEPGLYCRAVGGIRVEDMVIVQSQGCHNLNRLHEGLDWA